LIYKINFLQNQTLLQKELFSTVNKNFFLSLMEINRYIKRVINPTGIVISFLGPDGSGKSTIINALKKRELPFRRIDYFHLKPRLLGAKGNGKPVPNPHEKENYSAY